MANVTCKNGGEFELEAYHHTLKEKLEKRDFEEFPCQTISKSKLTTPLFCKIIEQDQKLSLGIRLLRSCSFYNKRDYTVVVKVSDKNLLHKDQIVTFIEVPQKHNAQFSIIEDYIEPLEYLRDLSLFKGIVYFTNEHELKVYRHKNLEEI